MSPPYAKQLSYWRGLTQVDGLLAKAYLHKGALQQALASINEAIEANEHLPDELYFVPRATSEVFRTSCVDLFNAAGNVHKRGSKPFPGASGGTSNLVSSR
jgi:hypothetical protein